jgi:RNA-directed DNA polymerase
MLPGRPPSLPMSVHIVEFSRVDSVSRLASAVGCDQRLIEAVSEFNRAPPDVGNDEHTVGAVDPPGFHTELRVPKKNRRRVGEFRVVRQVTDEFYAIALKSLARRLDLYLRAADIGFPSSACHGFVAGSSTYRNAQPHLGAKLLLTADIEDFFPSIKAERVVSSLVGARIPVEGAQLIAQLVTVRGHLPVGFSTSPMLSNLVCISLDRRLIALAAAHQAAYSRYADDLAFSSNKSVPTSAELCTELHAEGFELADEKFRTSKRGQVQIVTGLSIADPSRPRLPGALKRRLRQELFLCEKYGIRGHAEALEISERRAVNSIDGRIGYVQGIEPVLGEKLRDQWRTLLLRDGLQATYPRTAIGSAPESARPGAVPTVTVVMDESRWSVGGQDYFAVGAVLVDDPELTRAALASLAKTRADDLFFGGRINIFEKRGFHYADDIDRAKDEVCRLLADQPVRASLAFGRYRDELTLAENYVRLFEWLIARRMGAADGKFIEVICDRLQEVPQRRLVALVEARYARLCELESRRPRSAPIVSTPKKGEDSLLAVPDYLLGVFSAYHRSQSVDFGNRFVRRFEQLRDRYRLIRDFDSRVSYTRSRQFVASVEGAD